MICTVVAEVISSPLVWIKGLYGTKSSKHVVGTHVADNEWVVRTHGAWGHVGTRQVVGTARDRGSVLGSHVAG